MSEGSKMGLFGSKDDKTESTSNEATKQNSPDRYAPYCIDSDSETYDTEALSIMDINDIIGVQTGGAAESTLESEIAALSEIITDSKGETTSDTINQASEENSEIKFNEELLSELTSLSSSENPLPTTSQTSFQQHLIMGESKVEHCDEKTEDGAISGEIKDLLEVKTDLKIADDAAVEAKVVAVGSNEQNNELKGTVAEPESESAAKKESALSSEARSPEGIQNAEILAAAVDKPATVSGDVTESTNSETEAISDDISQVGTQSLKETLGAVKIDLDNERTEDIDGSLKREDLSVVPAQNADINSSNITKDADFTVKTKPTEDEEEISNPADEKVTDVLTNVGSISKSLQLIGEAYISEDSQEIDEDNEPPVPKLADLPVPVVEEEETVEKVNDPLEESNSDVVVTDTLINEANIIVPADTSDSADAKCSLDDQDSTLLRDITESDNTQKVLPNLEDNHKDSIGQDTNIDSQLIVESKDDRVIEDKPADSSLYDDENIDKSDELVEITSVPTASIDKDANTTPQTTVMLKSSETKEELLQRSEQLEDTSSNPVAETVRITSGDEAFEIETNQNPEKLDERTSEETKLLEKAVESSTATSAEEDKVSTMDSKPLEELESLPSIVSAGSKTESDNTTEVDAEIQIENTKVSTSEEPSELIDKQDSAAVAESNTETEIVDSKSSEESLSNLRDSIIEDKIPESDSKPSLLSVEMSINLQAEDDRCTTATTSAEMLISREEQAKEMSGNVEQFSETVEDATEDLIGDDTVKQDNPPLVIKNLDNEENESKDEHSGIHEMVVNISKEEEKINSESNEPRNDDVSQFVSTENISTTIEETGRDASNDMQTNEDASIGDSKEEIDEAKNLPMELNQLTSTSCVENNAAAHEITEENIPEERKLSSDIAKPDLSTYESIEKKFCEDKDGPKEMDKAESSNSEIQMELDIDSSTGAGESEMPSSIANENIQDSTSENIIPIELDSLEVVEPNSSNDDLNNQETIEKSLKSEEISGAERVDDETPVEPRISETRKEEVTEIETEDQAPQIHENESAIKSSVCTDEKEAQDTSDKDNAEVLERKTITESSTEIVSEKTAILAVDTLDVSPSQDLIELASQATLEIDETELKIQPEENQGDSVDSENQQELDCQLEFSKKDDETRYQKLSHLNVESSSGDVRPSTTSEDLSDVTVNKNLDSSEIQLEQLSVEANLQPVIDEFLSSPVSDESMKALSKIESKADVNLPLNSPEKTCVPIIEVKELEEVESKLTLSSDVPKLLEVEEKLEEEELLPTNSVEDENLDGIGNTHPSEKNLELSQTPGGKNEEGEDDFEGVVSNLGPEIAPINLQSDNLVESQVEMDGDLQCQSTEELEYLPSKENEIIINELADVALRESTQSLESINKLEILPDSHLSVSTNLSSEESKSAALTNELSDVKEQSVSYLSKVNERFFMDDLNETPPSLTHDANYITDVLISSTNIDNVQPADNKRDMDHENVTADKLEQQNLEEILKTSEILIPKDTTSMDENLTDIDDLSKLGIEEKLVVDKSLEINLPLKQDEEKLIECAVLRACDAKINLSNEVLFDSEDAEQSDVLCGTSVDNADTSQQSSEFSELECAVKFLQESEEQTIDSPLLLSPKIAEEIIEENSQQSKSGLFLSETEVCQNALELPAELEEITPDSIAISEAEIISEAAKLESERMLKIAAEMSKPSESIAKYDTTKAKLFENSEMLKSLLTTSETPSWEGKPEENVASTSENTQIPKLSENIIRRSEKIPKISILEERLKEPPKIEIPVPEVSPRISDAPTTPKTSLLIQRDSKIDTKLMYQKMLESPKGVEKSESKIVETPRKDSDKHDFENVGSPRIILKIAKSAIADCGEPRSPKSPKIRSAANSPNPEDSPGQKLGKIKLKLSRGGHPSIILNENFDEPTQRHTEAILSPSHIGMKIKLSKTGDASIIQPEKHDSADDIKEGKHKFDDVSPKRIDSPLGMKIKLSKTGDPSIVQQESKESTSKRKDKLDIGQEIPKRTDSPIGMKIKLSKSGDASIIQPEKQESLDDAVYKDKFDISTEIPKRTESPIGMKIKLSKTGDASIISSEGCEEFKDSSSKSRDKLSANQDIPKRTDSPLGMKFKLTKSGGASIIQPDKPETFEDLKDKLENTADITKRVESPIGMKIKLLKTGDASIIHPEKQESDEHKESIMMKHRDKTETQEIQKRTDSPIGMRIKVTKTGEASVVPPEDFSSLNMESFDMTPEVPKRNESPIGMKIKLSKSGDASIIHPEKQEFFEESKDCLASGRGSSTISQEGSKSAESSLGMKIKLSKTGDASIIHSETSPESKDIQSKRTDKLQSFGEGSKRTDSPLGMKIKLSKTGDASIIEPDKKEKSAAKQKEKLTNVHEVSQKRKDMEFPLEMKIKLSKTGHPTIIANEKQESFSEMHSKSKDHPESAQSTHHRHAESMSPNRDSQLRIFKTGHSTIIQSNRSEVTIEPIQMVHQKPEGSMDVSGKCKDVLISPVEHKKSKLESKLSHILPEVTIQPVMSGEQKQITLDKKSSSISRQQMSVINQEISITQVPLSKPADLSMSGKLKEILRKNASNSPANSDCEIIEHRPELIIVNENSNSSQDIMIIQEVKAPTPEVKVPRKRGRPKRSALPPGPPPIRHGIPQDPLALDNTQPSTAVEHRESDRPKRTCRSQKSYAPPKRGRGRGRGKRKMDRVDCAIGKIPRLEDPLTAIEISTMSLIAPLQPRMVPEPTPQTSELYKALKQSPMERKRLMAETVVQHGFPDKKLRLETESGKQLASNLVPVGLKTEGHSIAQTNLVTSDPKAAMISEMLQFSVPNSALPNAEKLTETPKPESLESKSIISDMTTTEHQNWLTPSIKLPETSGKTEAISMVQVMDEETRMSAESNSRSQTPARNISMPAVETVINEESQGSVLSTATTESEKVKVKNRRMEINFDPDEGPFTVDKIAEYEWPLDRKGDTFMIQEQISQYLGVKSFKRKYPDLKRRMVEMEERNYLRENCLVSEAMCDMGLTAICSTEVLDIMCSDFPDQYEEYRKHMREKQAKEHSKKQKELTAAANAERNRIDLAEMAVQSALSWNVNFNKARKESRKYSLDLQSFTIHVPKKQLKVDAERKASNYPVALIPGQYTDYYREYTPAELRYYPLNTVLYGPMRPNERKFDSQSEGSQSDSDSDSSSDDSSSSSSEGTQDTEESQSTVDDVDMEIAAHKEDNKNLKCKMCLKHLNKHGKAEVLIQCGTCNGNVHPSCIDLTLDMVPHIQGYSWQCTDCKTCVQCHNPADEDKMLFCDMCDRGYHIYCVGLRRVPQGRWHCRECAVCASCGLRQPGGANSDRNSVAQWQHEYKKGERNTRIYVSTLCVPCSKLWRKGRYCPHCSRCHSAQRLDLEPNLVHCGACDKYLHLGCVEIRSGTLDRKNYICECCSTPNQQHSRSLTSKTYKI